MNNAKDKPWETVVSTSPVFFKVADAPVGITVPEICEAAEVKIGFGRIAGAVRKPSVWRIHGKTPADKAKLLEGINPHIVIRKQVDNDKNNEYRNYVITLYSKNPMSNSIGADGKIIPSTRLSIDGLFLSVSMEDLKKTLEKIPGVVMKSPIFFDRAFLKNKTLSRFVNGRRFVYIDEPAQNAPLPPNIKVGAFQASLFYKGMPVRCWDCHGPHRRGDKSCKKFANKFNKSTDRKQQETMNGSEDVPEVNGGTHMQSKTSDGQTDKTVDELLRDLRRSPHVDFNSNETRENTVVVGSGNQNNDAMNAKTMRSNSDINCYNPFEALGVNDHFESDQSHDTQSSSDDVSQATDTDGEDSSDYASDTDGWDDCPPSYASGTDGWEDGLPSSGSDTDGWDDYLHQTEIISKVGDNSSDGEDSHLQSGGNLSEEMISEEYASSSNANGDDNDMVSDDTVTGSTTDSDGVSSVISMEHSDNDKSDEAYFTPRTGNQRVSHIRGEQENTPVKKCDLKVRVSEKNTSTDTEDENVKLQDQTSRLKDRLLSDPAAKIMSAAHEADESHGGDFMCENTRPYLTSGGEENKRSDGKTKRVKKLRKKVKRVKSKAANNGQPPITQHFQAKLDNKRVFSNRSSGEDEVQRPSKNMKPTLVSPGSGLAFSEEEINKKLN